MKRALGTLLIAAASVVAAPQLASAGNGAYPPDPPTQQPAPAQPTGVDPNTVAGSVLPTTGGQSSQAVQIAVAALATGGVLVFASRRRRRGVV